jgi:hypothetical protein
MQYALLMYSPPESAAAARGPIDPEIAAVLDRPNITGWLRLYPHESATSVRREEGTTLLTDGPFIDSKEFLGGFIIVEADDLDGALALAAELHEIRPLAGIEVRPVLEQS